MKDLALYIPMVDGFDRIGRTFLHHRTFIDGECRSPGMLSKENQKNKKEAKANPYGFRAHLGSPVDEGG